MAKKARTAAQKAADRKRSREMKGKRPKFLRKRRSRRASSKPKRHRRRTRMAKKRRSGGRRKAINLMDVAKAAPAVVGVGAALKQMWDSYQGDKDALHASTGIVLRGNQVALDKAVPIGIIAKAGGGIVASKVVAAVINKTPAPAKRILQKIHA